MDDIAIIYLGQEVVIPGFRREVLERKNRYLVLADKAEKKFLQKYYDKYGDFFAFANKYAEDVSDFLRPYYKSMVHELVECGIYDASIDGIFQKYGEFLAKSLLELQNGIKDLCNRASDGMETAMAVRELRKATRTQMVGGGFGLTGALAGMAVSGAYNTVSGLLHSGANAIGNSRMRYKINEKFQNIYKSEEFRELVGKCIWDSVFSIKYVIEDCLGHVEVIPDSEYKSKAKALRSNFPRIPEDAKQEVALEILTLAPDELETYRLLLPLYGDFGGGLRYIIQNVAPLMIPDFDNLRKEIFQEKAYIIFEDFEKALQAQLSVGISDNDIETIQNRAEKRIVWNAATVSYSLEDSIVSSEIHAIQNRTAQLRTVNGVAYDTLILAEKALANRKICENLWPTEDEKLNYSQLCKALQKVQSINEDEPKGAVSDYIVIFSELLQKANKHRAEEFEARVETVFLDLQKRVNEVDASELNQQKKDELQKDTENQILVCAESFGFLGTDLITCQAIQRVTPQVTKLCEEREKQSRTVNGVTYSTVELAEKATDNRINCESLWRSHQEMDYRQLCEAINVVRSLNDETPKGSVSDYLEKLHQQELDTRTINDVLYDTFELAEKARANRRDGEKLVQACNTTENIDVVWVLQRLQQLNHRDPVGSTSDYVDEMLVKHFGRKDTKDYAFNGVLFPSIIDRQDTECEFRLLINKYMPGNPTSQGITSLKAELNNISNISPLYKLVSAQIESSEKVLYEQQASETAKAQEQQIREAAKVEVEQEQPSTLKSGRIGTGISLCFGVLFLNAILNTPLIALDGTPCIFSDIINAAIHGGGLSAIALALLYVIFGFYIIKELLKAVATLFTQRGNRKELFGYSAWLCLFVIAFSIIGGNHFDCESRVFIWLIVSLVGYACIDNRH